METHFFDYKSKAISTAKLQKVCVAFANADGGEVLIGVEDSKEGSNPLDRWDGHQTIEEYNSHIQGLYNLNPSLPLAFEFYACPELTGLLLSISVEKSGKVAKSADGNVYVRRNASSVPYADSEKIRELEYSKGIISFEEELVPNADTEAVAESKTLGVFLNDFSPKTSCLDYVVNEYLIDRKSWTPKYAGLLLFCDSPAAILPRKCSVKIARYETKGDELDRDALKETWTVEGPVYSLINDSISKINTVLSKVTIWTIDGIKTVSYPAEALWEVFVNAIIHRDYSISDDVQILIYDNRVEIKSPGKLPAHVTANNILQERFTRNTKLVRTLARYKNPPNKDLGEGLNTAFQKMKEWKLQQPVIEEKDNYVVVTIAHTPLARPEELVLEFLNKNPSITNKQGRDLSGIRDSNEMKRVFYKLRDSGEIEPVPEMKGVSSAWRKKGGSN